jgi:hypothetical protein
VSNEVTLGHDRDAPLDALLMTSTDLDQEHPGLVASARDLLDDLVGFERRLTTPGVEYGHHYKYARRAEDLQRQLEAALVLSERDLYAPAFAVLRSALEQILFDRLMFAASGYRRRTPQVTKEAWDKLHAEFTEGADWARNVSEVDWVSGTLTVTYSGIHPADTSAQIPPLSPYFWHVDDYDPFHGRPDEQLDLQTSFRDVSEHIEYAQQLRAMYSGDLRWPDIIDNIRANKCHSDADVFRIHVHYRFLSAFVHPLTNQHDLLYGRNYTGRRFDHYSSELILLYVNFFAAYEMRSLIAAAGKTANTVIGERLALDNHLKTADEVTAHLWFIGQQPTDYNRVTEANERGFVDGNYVPREGREPDSVPNEDIKYYRNPLRRIIRMHHSANEWVGFSYVSPWPRNDAHLR